MSLAISVEGISKQYRLGLIGAQSLREEVNRWWHRVRKRKVIWRAAGEPYVEGNTIWALRDVSFQVDQGDAVGIIGRNGAGKSTLLKILSGITSPTKGVAKIKGRVASLLEIGAGFHPELSGRDNIYLNGVILGMKKTEVARRFDEIVAFSEIEKFIDTPVKHYSSGMYVRLAFAVAAHVDAEILLVDEALAVGDALFQNKCISRMKEFRKSGRTVLYVSHNLSSIESFCKTAYVMEGGSIAAKGDPQSVIETYYKMTFGVDDVESEVRPVPEGTVKFLRYETGSGGHYAYCGSPCNMKFYLLAKRTVEHANFGLAIWANDGTLLWAMRSLDDGGEPICLKEGLYAVNFTVPSIPLRPGSYQIHVSANDLSEGTLDSWYARPKLVVLTTRVSGLSSNWQGILDLKGEFELTRIEEDQKLTMES